MIDKEKSFITLTPGLSMVLSSPLSQVYLQLS